MSLIIHVLPRSFRVVAKATPGSWDERKDTFGDGVVLVRSDTTGKAQDTLRPPVGRGRGPPRCSSSSSSPAS